MKSPPTDPAQAMSDAKAKCTAAAQAALAADSLATSMAKEAFAELDRARERLKAQPSHQCSAKAETEPRT